MFLTSWRSFCIAISRSYIWMPAGCTNNAMKFEVEEILKWSTEKKVEISEQIWTSVLPWTVHFPITNSIQQHLRKRQEISVYRKFHRQAWEVRFIVNVASYLFLPVAIWAALGDVHLIFVLLINISFSSGIELTQSCEGNCVDLKFSFSR